MRRAEKMVIVLFFIFYFIHSGVSAQFINTTLSRYATEFPQERTYIHYDKASYGPGETIWFKAYLMEGVAPAFTSKTFYIDWTDDKGNLLYHTVSPLESATTNGQFEVPADYTGTFIHVKAYTRWMLNFDTAFIYEKDIRILSQKNHAAPFASQEIKPPVLTFFPEGGDAVEGTVNKIAFLANDQWGRPVKITGTIKDSQGKTIDTLRVLHDGMGYFFLFPTPAGKYTAVWKDENKKEYRTVLPSAIAKGVSIQVAIDGDRRNFVINANEESAAYFGAVHLVGTMNQYPIFNIKKIITNGIASGTIPTANLPSGVLTLTVFDTTWHPLAERITYIDNKEYRFETTMEVQHWGLNKRARNEIEITVPDSLYTNLSIAVTDVAIDRDTANNIISGLLLTSDLKGSVYNPAWYFAPGNKNTQQYLDLVMLTHGWRRFKWEDVVQGKMPVINNERDTTYLSLSGKIYGATQAKLRDNPYIIVIVSKKEKNGENKMLLEQITPDGSFADPTAIIFDTAHIYYQLSKGIKDATVKFMESRLPAYHKRVPANGQFYNQSGDTTGYTRHFLFSDEMKDLLARYKGITLENVTLKPKTKDSLGVMDEKYATGLFSNGNAYQFDLVNDRFAATSFNIFSYLQGKVPGLQISGSTSSPSLQWRGGTPLFYLDEAPVDATFLASVSVNDIAYVKVLTPPFMGAPGGGSGAIAIYTRRGDDAVHTPGKGLENNTITGYTAIREFYSPDYSSFNPENEKKDIRTTLYWNPRVITSPKKNKAKLVFYNNDETKSFRVIIEGMSLEGKLTRLEQIME